MVALLTAKAVVDAFNALKTAAGKPTVRPNGVREWTVLSGVVALIPSGSDYEPMPILLATGVKALPDRVREYSNGRYVHDMHAEILSLRLLNWFLLDECESIVKGQTLRLIERMLTDDCEKSMAGSIGNHHSAESETKMSPATPPKDSSRNFQENASDRLSPYPSAEGPEQGIPTENSTKCAKILCDDASATVKDEGIPPESAKAAEIERLYETSHDPKGLQKEDLKSLKNGGASTSACLGFRIQPGIKFALYISEAPCGDASMSQISNGCEPWIKRAKSNDARQIFRGREHFDQLGVVRTKPGRVDSVLTLSKSCSDKLCVKQLTGICNLVSAPLFPEGVFLDYLVLGRDKVDASDFKRCFHTRFCDMLSSSLKKRPLQLALYESDEYPFHKPAESDSTQKYAPALLSLLYVVPQNTVEVINNGVRFGALRKKQPPRPGGESFVCNHRLVEKFKQVQKCMPHQTYLDMKQSQTRRQALKHLARQVLGGWQQTSLDDFLIESKSCK